MLSVIPAINLLLLFLIAVQKSENGWRSAILQAAMIWGVALTIITEVLSLFQSLTSTWVTISWILFSIFLLSIYHRSVKQRKGVKVQPIFGGSISFLKNPYLKTSLFGLLIIVSLIAITALVAPPNTNDSMGYHMPRVVNWIQNQSVSHYPTHYTAQLYLSPWSAFAILHLQVLSGGDRFANLIQFFSMIGSIIGVSLIAQRLGAKIYGQMLASVFCATLPMGILQASSTQNDYVVAFWLVCLVYYVLLTLQQQPQRTYFWEIGTSLGLAALTKPTAYVYAFPFLLWLLVQQLKLEKWKPGKPYRWKHLIQIGIPTILINLCHYLRNLEVFHTPLGKSPQFITYTNQAFSVPILVSNIIRNLSLHVSTPSSSFNKRLYDFINWIHSSLKVDINDPRTSGLDFQINSLINHEDLAGNTLHLILIITSTVCFALFLRKKQLDRFLLLNYILSILACFILFCSLLTWTPFHSRLHLFMFVIASPFIGTVLSALARKRVVSFVTVGLLLLSSPWILFNETRPLIANSQFITDNQIENIFNTNRSDLYFMGQRYFREPTVEATQIIEAQQCSNIGLSFYHMKVFEYPIWALLQKDNDKAVRLQHVGVTNESKSKYDSPRFHSFQPCLILNDTRSGLKDVFEQQGLHDRVWSRYPLEILVKHH